jgi:hypothetical protein
MNRPPDRAGIESKIEVVSLKGEISLDRIEAEDDESYRCENSNRQKWSPV